MGINKKAFSANSRMHRPVRPQVPALEWARDISGRAARITAVGNSRILVENHTCILDYSDQSVRLDTHCGCIVIHGIRLTLRDVRRDALIIDGLIQQVILPCEGGRTE